MSPGGPLARLRGLTRSVPLRIFGLGAALAAGIALVAMGTAMEVSSQPAFCGSCHIMTPYYDSWRESSHRNIACVDCHIPPGVTAELRKKYEALSMVARYFTGTYGTNPWAEIDDAACLQCHERRLLSGRELFGDVLFDHTAHLSGMRRGKTLRCTSCHSQIVQGSHIAVTASTCILCHFKDQPSGTGTARCTMCHNVTETEVRHGAPGFNHADVARFGMECTSCHARPAGSDGAVPRERCATCHNRQDRLAEYDDTDLLHRAHVAEHKIDCTNCHLEIEHVGTPHSEQAKGECGTCHRAGHSPQHGLYSGRGGRGVEPMPDAMFLAGVRCEGCHIAIPGQDDGHNRASEVSCMSCHGPGYRRIYQSWTAGLQTRIAAFEPQMKRTEALLGGSPPEAFADARFNLDMVARGRGIHNVRYSQALLRRAHEDMNAARRERGLSPLKRPWSEPPYESPCFECHSGIETQRGTIFEKSFAHAPHVGSARVDCVACHRPHDERAGKEIVRFDAAGCASCHHRDSGRDCLECHEGIRSRKVESPLGPFDHEFHIDGAGQACADCHDLAPGRPVRLKTGTCEGCHG